MQMDCWVLARARENLRKVLVMVMMAEASLNPNKEWSVNTVPRWSRDLIIIASSARLENVVIY